MTTPGTRDTSIRRPACGYPALPKPLRLANERRHRLASRGFVGKPLTAAERREMQRIQCRLSAWERDNPVARADDLRTEAWLREMDRAGKESRKALARIEARLREKQRGIGVRLEKPEVLSLHTEFEEPAVYPVINAAERAALLHAMAQNRYGERAARWTRDPEEVAEDERRHEAADAVQRRAARQRRA